MPPRRMFFGACRRMGDHGEYQAKTDMTAKHRTKVRQVRIIDIRRRIIDISVEGISMVVTQRSKFASVIQRNGVEGLI